jgi:hypothetical protein
MAQSAAHRRALNEARRKERAATKKVSRNEADGINLNKSQFDPRVGARRLETMSTRELKTHTRRLDAFVSRRTQFVNIFGGTPAPRAMWQEYQRLQAINNERAQRFLDTYGQIRMPGQDQTISGRIKATTPEQRANNQGRIHEHIEREPWSVTGTKQLQTLIDSMKKKAAGDYLERTIRSRLNSGEAALRNAGFEDMIGDVEQLTEVQQQLLVDASTFFGIAVDNMIISPLKGEVEDLLEQDFESEEGAAKHVEVGNALREQIEWVKNVVPRNPRDERGRFISRESFIKNLVASYDNKPPAGSGQRAITDGKTRRDNRRRPKGRS